MRFFASNAKPFAVGALELPQPGRQQVSGRKTVLAAADNAAFRKAFSRVFRVDTLDFRRTVVDRLIVEKKTRGSEKLIEREARRKKIIGCF